MKKIISFLMITLLLYSCKNEISDKTIKVDIDAIDNVSIHEFFDKIEIIKLENNPDALISYFKKIISFDEKYYILDLKFPVIYIFDNKGKYLNKINNKGQGPNEYLHISDFEIDTISKKLTILDPTNSTLHEYDLNGNFKKRISLPRLSRCYSEFRYINPDLILFWTYDYENRAKFYSVSKNKILNETFPENENVLNDFELLFAYRNFLGRPISNTVFEYTPNCEIEKSYTWDFGSLNNDEDKLNNNSKSFSKANPKTFLDKVYSSEIVNYIFGSQGGNSTYWMTQIMRKNKMLNILHNKKTNKNYVFEKTIEKAQIFPLIWTNDYIIGRKRDTDKSLDGCLPDEILDIRNRAIKKGISEFDNPVLIKYYFRKK